MAESTDSIELPDCEYESLLELFRFLYSDAVNLTGSNVLRVLYLAKKYMVPSLKFSVMKYYACIRAAFKMGAKDFRVMNYGGKTMRERERESDEPCRVCRGKSQPTRKKNAETTTNTLRPAK